MLEAVAHDDLMLSLSNRFLLIQGLTPSRSTSEPLPQLLHLFLDHWNRAKDKRANCECDFECRGVCPPGHVASLHIQRELNPRLDLPCKAQELLGYLVYIYLLRRQVKPPNLPRGLIDIIYETDRRLLIIRPSKKAVCPIGCFSHNSLPGLLIRTLKKWSGDPNPTLFGSRKPPNAKGWSRRPRSTRSSSPAVPPACQSQQSRPVPNGQPRTTSERPQSAPFAPIAGSNPARSGFGEQGLHGRGLHRPCRARPADRSLVAEDRSAGGVRDRTGPDPRSVLSPWRTGTIGARAVTNGHQGSRRTAGRPGSSSSSSRDAANESDCGPEGRFKSASPPSCRLMTNSRCMR